MELWINLVGYQIAWFVTVGGAGAGLSWPAWTATTLLCCGHSLRSSHKVLDLRLMVLAALLGALVDGFLASTGWVRYSPAIPAVPVSGCPSWILALWIAFSTTLTRSLGWLRGRIALAGLFGAVGGPLAYWAAERGWGVILFSPPRWQGLISLAAGWAIALALLVLAAGKAPGAGTSKSPPGGATAGC
jgi:hypothetical protein